MHPHPEHAALLATYQRAVADAAHKQSLILKLGNKGPKAIAAAVDTAAKAVKRRDSFARQLAQLGVDVQALSAAPDAPISAQ